MLEDKAASNDDRAQALRKAAALLAIGAVRSATQAEPAVTAERSRSDTEKPDSMR